MDDDTGAHAGLAPLVAERTRDGFWAGHRLLLYFGKRLLSLIPLLFLVSIIAFSLVFLMPGDPAVVLAGSNGTPEQIAAIRERLGENDPAVVQYLHWIGGVFHGNFGTSFYSDLPVRTIILERLPVTLSLTGLSIIVAVVFGGLLGIVAARWRGGIVDRAVTALCSLGIAMPAFWLALILVIQFSVQRRWFPAIGYAPLLEGPGDWLRHLILPVLALAASATASIARQVRTAMVDVLEKPYIRTAHAGGISNKAILGKYALKNAMGPVLAVIGLQVAFLFGGSVVVETIFVLPGLGAEAVVAVLGKDIPVIQALVLVNAVIVVLVNVVIDTTHLVLNRQIATE